MNFIVTSETATQNQAARDGYPLKILLVILMVSLLTACAAAASPATTSPEPVAAELVYYDWDDSIMAPILADFTKEYGIKVTLQFYSSQEEAVASIKTGRVYDVVLLENQFVPSLSREGLLAEIDRSHIPNFKNISPNFLDLAYDPGNKHTIPDSWGTTGLVVRSDLVDEPITRWADLWDPRYAHKVAGWAVPRYMMSVVLKSLGYSVNSENPAELEAALARLVELKPNMILLDKEPSSAPLLVEGKAVMAVGWSADVQFGREQNEAIEYVLPAEGAILWGDNFVIPANSPHQDEAELLLNFILRPEISGRIVNESYFPLVNDAALPFINPEILNDPIIYPPKEALKNAEIMLPLSPAGEKLYADIWDRFMAAGN
jgi:spermidine/putrescine transport system substrate-binding protein